MFISPYIVEVNLAPGASSSQIITVSNISPHTVQIASYVVVLAGQSDLSATDWIKVEPAQFLMAGFEEKTVEIKVVVPDQDMESGGRCALVGFDVKSVDPLQNFGVTDAQSDVPVAVNVQGQNPLIRTAEIRGFVPVLEPNGLIGFNVSAANTGNLHFSMAGSVEVTRLAGALAEKPAFPAVELVLPAEGLRFSAEPGLALTEGETYSAKVTINYGGEQPTTKEISFAVNAALSLTGIELEETPDGHQRVVMALANRGELALRPRMQVLVRSPIGETLGSNLTGGPNLLLPCDQGRPGDGEMGLAAGGERSCDVRRAEGDAFGVGRHVERRVSCSRKRHHRRRDQSAVRRWKDVLGKEASNAALLSERFTKPSFTSAGVKIVPLDPA